MSDHGYWWLALGLGLVVAVVAVVLLEIFLRQVHRIERGAELIWLAGKQVAANTATTWLLPETSKRLAALTDEAMLHVELLSPPAPATSTSSRAIRAASQQSLLSLLLSGVLTKASTFRRRPRQAPR